jgi:hypothetical protein
MSAAEPVSRVPPAAGMLGGLGLIPFIAGTALVLLSDATWAVDALRFYAAAILSFLGGVHWGLDIAGRGTGPGWMRLGGSVVPSLAAWLVLLLAPPPRSACCWRPICWRSRETRRHAGTRGCACR